MSSVLDRWQHCGDDQLIKKQLSVRFSALVRAKLDALVELYGVSLSQVIEDMVISSLADIEESLPYRTRRYSADDIDSILLSYPDLEAEILRNDPDTWPTYNVGKRADYDRLWQEKYKAALADAGAALRTDSKVVEQGGD